MTARRGALLVLFLALAAYANSLGNGFAYDDEGIVVQNPVVQQGNWMGAFSRPWWPSPLEGAGLYRPVTSASFAVEWPLFQGHPLGFHALNVLAHALVSLLVFLLLLTLGSAPGALAGAALFALHPVHTEAVANVVGRAELYSAFFYLSACLLYWRGSAWGGVARIIRLLALGALYLLALGSKEIGVTLPGALFLLEAFRPRMGGSREGAEGLPPLHRRLGAEAATYLLLAGLLAAYLGLRYLVLGTLAGERVAPVLELVGTRARVLTAIGLWFQYLRLLLFPVDLASDYDPGVLFPSESPDLPVLLGALVLAGLGLAALRAWKGVPLVSFGIAWFGMTVLPVSNLLFPAGTLLAERTLYLPSVGLCLAAAGVAAPVLAWPHRPRGAVLAGAVVLLLAFMVRTVLRNPSWMSTFVVQQTLHEDHPQAWRAFRARAQGLERVGETGAAAEAWDVATRLAPRDYTLLVQAGDFHGRVGDWRRGEAYLRGAVAVAPRVANAYQILAGHLLRRGEGRAGHGVALEGLARAGPDARLWALVSESYLLKGDLPGALRAREAALGVDPGAADQWRRLGEIRDFAGDSVGATAARERARQLEAEGPARAGTDGARSDQGAGGAPAARSDGPPGPRAAPGQGVVP